MTAKTEDVTSDEPQIVPNSVQLKTVAMPMPPRILPTHLLSDSKMLPDNSSVEAM